MDEFKGKAKQFLAYYPNYGLLTSSCQTYSSWAYHELSGCRSLAQSEKGNKAFEMYFGTVSVVFVCLFLVASKYWSHEAMLSLFACFCFSLCACLVGWVVATVNAH